MEEKIKELKLKYEIYQKVYSAISFDNPKILEEELKRIKAQLEILEEG